jgi:hypothetical protein
MNIPPYLSHALSLIGVIPAETVIHPPVQVWLPAYVGEEPDF